MECPFCRRQTNTPGMCEWCRQPLPIPQAPPAVAVAPPNPLVAHPAPPQAPGLPPHPQTPYSGSPVYPVQAAPQAPYAPQGYAPQPPYAAPPSGMAGMPTLPASAPPVQTRVSLTGEVVEVAPPQPAQAVPGYAVVNAPLPPRAVSAEAVAFQAKGEANPYVTEPGARWEKFLAFAMPTAALTVALMHWVPNPVTLAVLPFVALLLMGLFLGASAAVPSYDDALTDCLFVLGASYLCGPVVGLAVAVVLGLVQQEFNAAVIATLAVNVLVRAAFSLAAPITALWLFPMPHIHVFSIPGIFDFGLVCASFFGWIFGGMFRPDGE